MKNAVVCIAKNEDLYIDEWMRYHLKLGFDEIWVYQNDWRYSGPFKGDPRVKLVEFDGLNMQLKAYNDFLEKRSSGYDFVAFFDVDEYMCLNHIGLRDFLSGFDSVAGIALNWKLFGDSGLAKPENGDYSCAGRFTKCQKGFNKHVKTIVNVKFTNRSRFVGNPHCVNTSTCRNAVVNATGTKWVQGPFNPDETSRIAWLNHYYCKTLDEFTNIKTPKGRADVPPQLAQRYMRTKADFDKHNFNEEEDLTAKEFFGRAGGKGVAAWYTLLLAKGWQDILSAQLDTLDRYGIFGKIDQLNVFAYPLNGEALDAFAGRNVTVYPVRNNMFEFPALQEMKRRPADVNMYFHVKGVSYDPSTTAGDCCRHWGQFMLEILCREFDRCVNELRSGRADCVGSLFRQRPWPHYSGNFFMASKAHLEKLGYADIRNRMNAESYIASCPGKYLSLFNNGYRDMHKEKESLTNIELNPQTFQVL